MADLMTTVKEANSELSEELKGIDTEEISKDEEKLKNFIEKSGKITIKHHEKVKEQVSLDFFAHLMTLDMQYNFVGGAVLNKEGGIEINI